MCRFNSFSPGQKAILVGNSGIHENPRFPPLSNKQISAYCSVVTNRLSQLACPTTPFKLVVGANGTCKALELAGQDCTRYIPVGFFAREQLKIFLWREGVFYVQPTHTKLT